jgi:hypothetical protein
MDLPADPKPQGCDAEDQVHMSLDIILVSGADGFAENKDEAKVHRLSKILPALMNGNRIVLDFAAVRYATQSYVHALIGEALKKFGEQALELIEFRNCSPQVRSAIELVVDYSLDGFAEKRRA